MQRIHIPILACIVILSALLLLIDLLVPLGVSVWLPYVGIVLLSLWLPRPVHVYATTAICSLLILVGLLGSEQGDAVFWKSALNRLFGIAALWLAAVMGLAARKTHELQEANRRLQQEILEREKLQAQLLRTQRLESIGTLASGIAHDLNNLLTPILMSAKLLKEDRTDAERRRLLETLLASAERGADIVRQLLSFSGGAETERSVVQMTHVVREVKSILEHTFPKGIQIDVHVDKGLKPVHADSTQLTQVLMNLCVNARDAMPNGGKLTITARNADGSVSRTQPNAPNGPCIMVCVADTGVGIRTDVLDKVFDPFFTTKEHGKGTGLGLSTALGIVKSHDGFIDVVSEVGKGSRFSVYLPAYSGPPAPTLTPKATDAPHGQGRTIMVVDDEPLIVETATISLQEHGYCVVAAADGYEAVALFKQRSDAIAAVLVDMMMPVMDGTATIDALQALAPGVRIIASSGLRLRGKLADDVAAGTLAFLQKPYTDKQLLDVLATVLR